MIANIFARNETAATTLILANSVCVHSFDAFVSLAKRNSFQRHLIQLNRLFDDFYNLQTGDKSDKVGPAKIYVTSNASLRSLPVKYSCS